MWARAAEQLLIPALLAFLMIGALGSLALGVVLALRPQAALAFIHRMNRFVSTRRSLKPLEVPREAGPLSATGRRVLGVLLLLGAGFSLYVLADSRLALGRAGSLTALAVEAGRWFLLAGCALAVALGVLLLFFPRALAAVEASMNRWVSTRQLVPSGGEEMKTPLDQLVEAHPKVAGALIAAASLAVVTGLWLMIPAKLIR